MTITACLGHGLDDTPNGCPLANKCERHLILRDHKVNDEDEVLIGSACQFNGAFLMYVEASCSAPTP